MCVSLASLLKSLEMFLEHTRVSLKRSVAEHSNPPMSKGRRHEAEAIEFFLSTCPMHKSAVGVSVLFI